MNSFFKKTDSVITEIHHDGWNFTIPEGWWSRSYEYHWAVSQNRYGFDVADMGAGGEYRPFKDLLSINSRTVAAIDMDPKIMETPCLENVQHYVCDFYKLDKVFQPEQFDQIFCISVLEDLPGKTLALKIFKDLLTPEGEIILTIDVKYDYDKPNAHYPGIYIGDFIDSVENAGLEFTGPVDLSKDNVVYHDQFNLCVFHTKVRRKK